MTYLSMRERGDEAVAQAADEEDEDDEEDQELEPAACRPQQPGDRVFDVVFHRGPVAAELYCALMRQLAGRWVLVRLDLAALA